MLGLCIAVYPGSFDPVTNGHLDIIARATSLFEEVVVAVATNPNKRPLFSVAERVEMIQEACVSIPRVRVVNFDGLLMDFVRMEKAQAIIRGLRAVSDFENEFQMALMNKKLNPGVETVFLMTKSDYAFLSSSIVKEVASFGGQVDCFLPSGAAARLRSVFNRG